MKDEEWISELCLQYQKAKNPKEKEFYFGEIEDYCNENYYRLINCLQAERDDVWQDIMLQMFQKGIDRYLERRRSTTFEAFFLTLAKNRAYELSNQEIGRNVAAIYSRIKEVGEKYGIPVAVENAHKFSRLMKKGNQYSINKIIYAIEGYFTKISFESLMTDSYS